MFEHPMFPSLELLKRWEDLHFDEGENYDVMLIQAYQAGADAELEACCEWIPKATPWDAEQLRAARRPKPPSLKEQALALISHDPENQPFLSEKGIAIIRRALETLPS